jgi:hypothetical protein
MLPVTMSLPIVPLNEVVVDVRRPVRTALIGTPRNEPVTVPKVTGLFEVTFGPDRFSVTSRMKGVLLILPLMSARGSVEGMDPEVEPGDAFPSCGGLGTVPVATIANPRADPPIELIVGVMPDLPVHEMVAEPRPRGMDLRLDNAAMTGIDRNTTAVIAITPTAAIRTLGWRMSQFLGNRIFGVERTLIWRVFGRTMASYRRIGLPRVPYEQT